MKGYMHLSDPRKRYTTLLDSHGNNLTGGVEGEGGGGEQRVNENQQLFRCRRRDDVIYILVLTL